MDINKRNRTELKEFFNEGDKPTEKQFAELVDANINQMEDGITKIPGNPLAIQAEGDTTSTQEVLQLYTDFDQDTPNWSVNMNPKESDTAIPGLNIKDAAGKSRLFIQSNKGHVGMGTIEPDSKLTIQGDNDISLLSVIDATQQRAKIFEVAQQEGDGLVSVRNGKSDESVTIQGNEISFEDKRDTANVKSAKIASEEDTLKIYGKSSNQETATRTLEVVADEMNITGNVSMNNLSANPNLKDSGEASDRTIASQRAVKTYVDTRLPKGLISMWSGKEIPSGWSLCDGTNETPDLTGRFIVGFSENNNDYNKIGNTGGKEQVSLTNEQLPAHKHSGTTSKNGRHQHGFSGGRTHGDGGPTGSKYYYYKDYGRNTSAAGEHTHSFQTNEIGGNKPHENRPPYFVLAYIMKL